jgi:hypothetical protein
MSDQIEQQDRDLFVACHLLGNLRPDDRLLVGSALRLARVAAWQAARKWPTFRLVSGMRWTRPGQALAALPPDLATVPAGAAVYAEYRHDEVMIARRDTPTVFFVGGVEIGIDGATNMWGIPHPSGVGWKVRGLGAVGTMSMTTWARRHVVTVPRLHPRLIVDQPAFTTVPGWRSGRGPIAVVSPDAVFDFDDAGRMRLRQLGPGRTVADIEELTERQWPIATAVTPAGPVADLPETVTADDVEALQVLMG